MLRPNIFFVVMWLGEDDPLADAFIHLSRVFKRRLVSESLSLKIT
jgi:hypothetical protein